MTGTDSLALVVVDLQRAFDDHRYWSPTARRDNPACEANVAALVAHWRAQGRPVVFVRHDSVEPGSPLAPGTPGNAFKPELSGEPDLLVTKATNSAFYGEPDLDAWLRDRGLDGVAVCGIQTNHCVETTARMGANLGHAVLFVADACHTFDRRHPDGEIVSAEALTRATVASLHGEFATVVTTAELVTGGRAPFAVARLDDLDRAPLEDAGWWRPVRRALGVSSVGINAYTADAVGGPLIEPHDERSPGSGRHEEVYVVLTGAAAFTVAGDAVAAPAGTFLRVDVGVERSAVAAAAGTTVLVVGGRPGAALPASPFEHWYAAQPASHAGDHDRAVAIASQGLADHPDHGGLNYQLACYLARGGRREEAAERLAIAFASDPRTREWAKEDADLDGVRRPAA